MRATPRLTPTYDFRVNLLFISYQNIEQRIPANLSPLGFHQTFVSTQPSISNFRS